MKDTETVYKYASLISNAPNKAKIECVEPSLPLEKNKWYSLSELKNAIPDSGLVLAAAGSCSGATKFQWRLFSSIDDWCKTI